MTHDPSRTEAPETAVPQLSWRSFGLALAVTLAIFFLLHPVWRPLDMADMDRNIVWSYAPIPALVLALLAVERKLRWSSWTLETLRLTLVKFAITFLFVNTVWAFVGPPGPSAPAGAAGSAGATPATTAEARAPAAPAPTPIDPARTGRLEGLVADEGGAPLAGVLVGVTGGLGGIVFAPPGEAVRLRHDGGKLQPAAAVVQVRQALILLGASDRLHTAAAVDEHGREVFNLPLLPGSERTQIFDRPHGPVTLRCTVDGRGEHATALVIVENPFAAWTGEDGRFRFEGVPVGDLELTAWGPSGSRQRVRVRLQPGAAESVRLTLP